MQRGTGDAVERRRSPPSPTTSTSRTTSSSCPATSPLLRAETLARLATEHRHADAAATLLTAALDDPTGYGRIVRDAQGRVDRIVEQADATADELEIDEVNPSIYCFRRGLLAPALRRLSPENAQGEYYLTDVVAVLRQAGHVVLGVEADDPTEALRRQRPRPARRRPRRSCGARINDRWMREGVDDGRSRAHLRRRHRRARARRPAAARARSSRVAPSSARAR